MYDSRSYEIRRIRNLLSPVGVTRNFHSISTTGYFVFFARIPAKTIDTSGRCYSDEQQSKRDIHLRLFVIVGASIVDVDCLKMSCDR